MSTYASKANFILVYGADELAGLADRNGDGVEDVDVVDRAAATANDVIDSHLIAAGYAVPLGVEYPTAKLTEIGCQLMRAGLYTNNRPDIVQKDYDSAMSYLTGVSKGSVRLIADDPVTSPTSAGGERTMVFNDDLWATYDQ